MLVNKKKKIIVLQNPKTGGQFKANQIVNSSNGFKRYHIMQYVKKSGEQYNVVFPFHITYMELKEFLKDDFKNWTIYVVVRNPYDRVASAINFRRKNVAQLYNDPDDSFEHVLTLIENHKEILKPLYHTIWFTAQSFWTGSDVHILKYENIDDWKFLNNLLGINDSEINIRPSYKLSDSIKNRIKNLYYEYDKKIFNLYNI